MHVQTYMHHLNRNLLFYLDLNVYALAYKYQCKDTFTIMRYPFNNENVKLLLFLFYTHLSFYFPEICCLNYIHTWTKAKPKYNVHDNYPWWNKTCCCGKKSLKDCDRIMVLEDVHFAIIWIWYWNKLGLLLAYIYCYRLVYKCHLEF